MARLEDQAGVPVFGDVPVEMGMHGREADLLARLQAKPCYAGEFAKAFPETTGRIDMDDVTKAIAAFERTLLDFDSPYDRFLRGEKTAIPAQAQHGAFVFTEMGCDVCHAGPAYTDNLYHRIGLPAGGADAGLIEKTGKPADAGKFRTTTLRNIALSGRYMHDGSVDGLYAAIMAHTKPFGIPPAVPMSAAMANDLVAFMQTLTDPGFITDARLGPPKACLAA
jgi:cytochrome c peroxidase